MRTLIRIFVFISTVATTSVLSYSQTFIHHIISRDTLFMGDTTTLLCSVGYEQDHLIGVISPAYVDLSKCNYAIDTFYGIHYEPYDDTIISVDFYIPESSCQGEYSIDFYDTLTSFMIMSYYPMWIIARPMVFQSPSDQLVCPGDTATFTPVFDYCEGCHYTWYKNNDPIPGENKRILSIPNSSLSDTGYYYCVADNIFGTAITDSVQLELSPLPGKPIVPNGIDNICQGTESSDYHIFTVSNATLYSWSLFPVDAGILNYADTATTITWDQDFNGQARILVKVKNGECRGPNSDTLDIFVSGPQEGPEICIVGVDAATGKNMVVWEKPPGSAVQNYIIYRETNQKNIYLPLDTIDADKISVYVDASSTPEWVSQRYKLSLIDTCGFESELSTPHKTIHLTNNMAADGKVNLIWDGYEGFDFLSYNLYHGPHPDSIACINTVPSNVFIYSNIVPYPGDNFFQIEAIRPEGCTPSLKSIDYGSSRSNILYVETEEVIEGISGQQEPDITLFPSPARDMVTIVIHNYREPVRARLVNVSSQLLQEFIIDSGSYDLDVSSFPEGLYILHIIQGNNSLKAKIVKSN